MMSIIDNNKYLILTDEINNFNTYIVKENDYDSRINYFIDSNLFDVSNSTNSNNYTVNKLVSLLITINENYPTQ